MLTPHCSAASEIVVPPSIVSTTRLRKSAEYGFAIHAGLLPAGSLNHIRAAMGIPDSAFPGNALILLKRLLSDFNYQYPGYPTNTDGFAREDDPMGSNSAASILDRILDTAADNLRIAKILVQMGLDPDNITYDTLFNRLLEIVLANITLANMFALLGAIFFVATLLTQTMVPLRVANMIGCAFFAIFGALTGAITIFLL